MADNTKRRVQRYDLVTPMLPVKEQILADFERILMSGQYILGQEVTQLEHEMAAACGVPDAVGVASGSEALYLALAMAGVRPGTEVITTPYTFEATIEAIIMLHARPVFVDIRPHDLNIDPARIEAAITPRTRAILPVHIFGAPADMDPIMDIAARQDLQVIVDMAQAWGTYYKGIPCGSIGRMSTLSFYPTKNLPGIGDGGLIFCREPEDAARIRQLRGHKALWINKNLYCGWNSRLDEVQAMVIRHRLARFGDEQRDRDRVAEIYDRLIPKANRLAVEDLDPGSKVTYHQYWVRCKARDRLRHRLDSEGIDTGIYYDPPLHHHPLMEYCRFCGSLQSAEVAGREVLTLPIHAALPFAEAERIGTLVAEFLERQEEASDAAS
ncbi:MAG: DegT/DnrJ/EryC1/StrS family aminotransferase [Candidatus Krumholzibacteria bacterium]|nr:DegT/DnrJ/EryC1/StrS family aminotransferase [Candidatus Krumholzibacteria bacterium]